MVEEGQLQSKVPLPVSRLVRVRGWLVERRAKLEQQHELMEQKQLVRGRGSRRMLVVFGGRVPSL